MICDHARTEGIHSKTISQTSDALWRVSLLGKESILLAVLRPLPPEPDERTLQHPIKSKQEKTRERDEPSWCDSHCTVRQQKDVCESGRVTFISGHEKNLHLGTIPSVSLSTLANP
jgi:hypothetical protein